MKQRKTLAKLKLRQDAFAAQLSGQPGYKQPGSLNYHKQACGIGQRGIGRKK